MHKKIMPTIVLLRILLGVFFFWVGLMKLRTGFSAEGYLVNATSGPFAEIFADLAGMGWVNIMVVYGEIAIGLGLITGTLVRLASASGILMMILYYLSALPPEHGPIDQHVIYAGIFWLLIISGAGRMYGIDGWLEKQALVVRSWKLFRYILG